MNIILYGLRGTGKTTAGQGLSIKLNKKLIDLDQARLEKFKQTTEEVIKTGGWPLFRQQEKETTLEIAEKFDDVIIAAGGGTMMDEENSKALKKNSKAILLTADIQTMMKRIHNDEDNKSNRPALTDQALEDEIVSIWEQRKDVFLNLADLVLDTSNLTIDQAVEKIVNFLK